ncbi:MAG: ROK family protein [Clostridia bacterium]|nr:ROK family protein [Clostridia bacterium]
MYTIGIDLGGTNIAAGIVNDNYEIIRKDSVPTGADRPGEEIVKDMAALCKKLIADEGLTEADIEYIGIATPGTADSDTGVVVYANNLPFLDFPIADLLKKHINIDRVLIENDANAAAKGEAVAGAAKGYANSVMITLGTGVGGGIIIDNKVYSGFNHAGAELGHIVIKHNGVPCSCGRKGCWEAYSSATALIRMTREKIATEGHATKMWDMIEGNLDNVSGRTAFNAAREGDKAGQEVVDMYIDYLASGLASIINIFQPEVLSIGGGISNEKDNLLIPVKERIKGETYSRDNIKATDIRIATLRNDAGIIGAAVLGR